MTCRAVANTLPRRDCNFFLDLIKKSITVAELNQTHAQIIHNNLQNDVIAITKLTQKLCELGSVTQASLLCSTFPKPDLFLYNVLIKGLSFNNFPIKSLSVYLDLRRNSALRPNQFTYSHIISASSSLSSGNIGDLLHGHAIVDGFASDKFVGSAIVDMYLSFGNAGYARKVFDKVSEPDTVLWNTVISGLVKNDGFYEAIRVFVDMIGKGSKFDSTTLASVLRAAAESQELKLGMMIQGLSIKVGLNFHDHVLTCLTCLYSKCEELSIARILFEEIERPDLISYNAMISGCTCNKDMDSAVRIFNELLHSGKRVNSATIVGLIPVNSPYSHLDLSHSIHSFSLKYNIVSSTSVSTALITVYSRLNEIESARKLFVETPERSLATWNAMISGYAQNGITETAISLFKEMQNLNICPNPVTVTSILSACAQLGALSLGKWVHELVRKEKFESNLFVSTALIDMYAKCGSINEARSLFDMMKEKNVVTYNAMISGYGLHGHGKQALDLFNHMVNSRLNLTAVSFLAILYACSHAGLVTDGETIFHSMVHDHKSEPSTEHYACMVDLFGRAGKLDKALDFIKSMPVKPGPAVWGTLLGACMTHKDSKLAEYASNKLFESDSKSVGYHVLLSNLYSSEQNYPQAAHIRRLVKKQNLVKSPGCTLIEINQVPHVFTSGDKSHPQAQEIYIMLEKLMGKMREIGFITEVITAFHDVEEEEKELMVNVHSEKLAIAFGLLNLEEGSEIRIIKNLRVCLDCHNFTKFVSKITNRVIVVRDANRFHHFENGFCSCGDYW